MDNKYLAILLVIFVICVGVVLYQYNNDVSTFIIVNASEVSKDSTVSGQLLDSYGIGVSNKTVAYDDLGKKTTKTNENGEFTIKVSKNNITNITFEGDGKYLPTSYENKITVV